MTEQQQVPLDLPDKLFLKYREVKGKRVLFLCSLDIKHKDEVYHGITDSKHHHEIPGICESTKCYKIIGRVILKKTVK